MTATRMLEFHFKKKAREFGYDPDQVYFSIGFVQGDYVELDGGDIDLSIIAPRLLYGKHLAAAKRAIDKGVFITSIQHGSLHWDINDAYEICSAFEIAVCENFCEALEEDFKSLQRTLLSDAHKYYLNLPMTDEGTLLREYSTMRFTVRVSLIEEELDDLEDVGTMYEDYAWAQILDVIHGHLQYGCLRVAVYDEDDDLIDDDHLGCVWVDTHNPLKSIYCEVREMLSQCRPAKDTDQAEAA